MLYSTKLYNILRLTHDDIVLWLVYQHTNHILFQVYTMYRYVFTWTWKLFSGIYHVYHVHGYLPGIYMLYLVYQVHLYTSPGTYLVYTWLYQDKMMSIVCSFDLCTAEASEGSIVQTIMYHVLHQVNLTHTMKPVDLTPTIGQSGYSITWTQLRLNPACCCQVCQERLWADSVK